MRTAVTSDKLKEILKNLCDRYNLNIHPFLKLLNSVGYTKKQLQAFALNIYYYYQHEEINISKVLNNLDLDMNYVESFEGVLPSVVFASNAYFDFVESIRFNSLSSIIMKLVEIYPPKIIAKGLNIPLQNRSTDILDYVGKYATTLEQQDAVIIALRFKLNVLHSILDSLYYSYVSPGFVPIGAFAYESVGTGVDN